MGAILLILFLIWVSVAFPPVGWFIWGAFLLIVLMGVYGKPR